MKKQKNNVYLSIAGLMAPMLWFILVIVLGWLEPGYSHMTKMMSILGGVGGIRGFIFNTGISTVGVLIILFAIGLWKKYAKYTLVTGIIANIPGIFFWIMVATIRIPAIEGLIQRAGIVFIFIWIGVMSYRMLQLSLNKKLK